MEPVRESVPTENLPQGENSGADAGEIGLSPSSQAARRTRSSRRSTVFKYLKSLKRRHHECELCGREFKTATKLKNHENAHNGVKPYVCKLCSAAFTQKCDLGRHTRYRHKGEKPHQCSECEYASVESSKLRRHMRCHTGERPYQCQQCTYAAADDTKLKRHMRTHSGDRPYQCDVCGKRFGQSNTLKAHQRTHAPEKPVFACELCPAKLGRKADLRIHMQRLHTSDQPLLCHHCTNSFPDPYALKMHIKTHKGEKGYGCPLCPYTTTKKNFLKLHLSRKHAHTQENP